jgi:N6-adenosine-specific RNA methylase IME4
MSAPDLLDRAIDLGAEVRPAEKTDAEVVEEAKRCEQSGSDAQWTAADCYAELQRRGWTQTRIAGACEVSQPHVSRCILCVGNYAPEHKRPLFREAYREVSGKGAVRAPRDAPPLPPGKFRLLLADPPWQYDFCETDSRRVENHYPTQDLDWIKALGRLPDFPAAPDAALFLWAPGPKLAEAVEVVSAWGFEYKTCLVWDKQTVGMGYWARSRTEHVLIAKRGEFSPPLEENRPVNLFSARRGEHSVKPELLYELIERAYPNFGAADRVELFARRPRAGWTSWGDEV